METIHRNHLIQTTVGIGVTALIGACCSRLVAPLSKTQGALIPLLGIIAKEVLGLKKDFTIPQQALITFSATSLAILSYRFSKGANLNITPVFVFSVAVTAANTVVQFCIAKFDFFKDSKVSTKTENTPLPSKTENTPLPSKTENTPLPSKTENTPLPWQILKNSDESKYNAAKNEIMNSEPADWSRFHFGSIEGCCDEIFSGIYLGDSIAVTNLIKPGLIDNLTKFLTDVKCIISLCSLSDMCTDAYGKELERMNVDEKMEYFQLDKHEFFDNNIFAPKEKEKKGEYAKLFGEHPFPNWLQLGENLDDHPDNWNLFVERNSKSEHRESKKIEDYFSESFALLDQAFLSKGAILVHCKAGQSRSSTLIIAWLISRFEVTAEQAENFLRSKRPCVKSKFIENLKEYETNLRNERLKSS